MRPAARAPQSSTLSKKRGALRIPPRLSEYADNCRDLLTRTTLSIMNHALDSTLQQLPLGEALIASGVEGLFHTWQASTEVIGKLCAGGAERWQAAIRQFQAPVNLADILRARTFLRTLSSP
jgi:hypothetical protein